MDTDPHEAMIVAMAEAMAVAEYYDIEPDMYASRDQFLADLRAAHHCAGGADFIAVARAGVAAQIEFFLTRKPAPKTEGA